MEKDKIVTFENFTKLNESFISLSEPNIDYEKVLADKFNTSLGHIVLVDSELHLYKIEDFGKVFYASILSKNDIESIQNKLIESMIDEIKSQSIFIDNVMSVSISPLRFLLSDFINQDELKSHVIAKIDKNLINNIIKTILESKSVGSSFMGPDEKSEYSIWFSELS
jgi:hypothetical protein